MTPTIGSVSRRGTVVVGVSVALFGLVSGVALDLVDHGDETCQGPPTVAIAVDVAEGVPEVRLVRPDGSVTTVAGPVASQPGFAPDGQRVVVVAAEGDYESAGPSSTELLAVEDLGEDVFFAGSSGRGTALAPCTA